MLAGWVSGRYQWNHETSGSAAPEGHPGRMCLTLDDVIDGEQMSFVRCSLVPIITLFKIDVNHTLEFPPPPPNPPTIVITVVTSVTVYITESRVISCYVRSDPKL